LESGHATSVENRAFNGVHAFRKRWLLRQTA
jgi:hypothetical protein